MKNIASGSRELTGIWALLARGEEIAASDGWKQSSRSLNFTREYLSGMEASNPGGDAVKWALSRLIRTMTMMADSLRVEYDSYASNSYSSDSLESGKLNETNGGIGKGCTRLQDEKRLTDLTEGRAEWQAALDRKLDDIRDTLEDEIEARILALLNTVEHQYLVDASLLNDPREFGRRVDSATTKLVHDLVGELDARAVAVMADFARRTGLNLDEFYDGAEAVDITLEDAIKSLGGITPTKSKKMSAILNDGVARRGVATMAGSAAGSVVGGFIGGFLSVVTYNPNAAFYGVRLGGFAGAGLVGLLQGRQVFKEAKKNDLEQARLLLRDETRQFIERTRVCISAAMGRSWRNFERFAQDELRYELNVEVEAISKSRQTSILARAESANGPETRRLEVESLLALIEGLLTDAREKSPDSRAGFPG